ncbi:hypothetical protein B0H21DRAFT_781484 [Amylocystis lapponica]|nr:hypothetical protein B0H21DRAFT_781484 [Amylocystis lapponica]
MTAPDIFLHNIRIVATVPLSVAVFCTLLRLYYRWSRRHLGMDDAWAAMALLASFFMLSGAWLHSYSDVSTYHRIMGYYMTSVCFTCVLWWARISILFSVVRIIPFLMVLQKWAYASVAWFFAMWTVMLVQKVYVCEHNDAWKHLPNVQCVLGRSVAAVELFSYIVTTIVSIAHSVFVFGPDRDREAYMAHIEASTALVICNLAVLVTWLVRVVRHGEDLESVDLSGGADARPRDVGQGSSQRTTIRFGATIQQIYGHM